MKYCNYSIEFKEGKICRFFCYDKDSFDKKDALYAWNSPQEKPEFLQFYEDKVLPTRSNIDFFDFLIVVFSYVFLGFCLFRLCIFLGLNIDTYFDLISIVFSSICILIFRFIKNRLNKIFDLATGCFEEMCQRYIESRISKESLKDE